VTKTVGFFIAGVAGSALLVVPGAAGAQAPPAVGIDGFAFDPPELSVLVGTTIVRTNDQTDVPHT
jgi:hypothetical protein